MLDPRFAFDYFFRTRTAEELEKRLDESRSRENALQLKRDAVASLVDEHLARGRPVYGDGEAANGYGHGSED